MMNNNFYSNTGSSQSTGRSRGSGGAATGYGVRFPRNKTIASSAIISNNVPGGSNTSFPIDYSNATNVPNPYGNLYIARSHPMVNPVMYNFADPFSTVACSNKYTTELTSEYSATYANDDENSGNTDVTLPSDFAGIMRHYEMLGSFEELNSKVHSGNCYLNAEESSGSTNKYTKSREPGLNNKDDISNYFQQMKAAHIMRQIEKYSINNGHHTTSNIEPKFKNVEQQTEIVQYRNVSQQTFVEVTNVEIDELSEISVKRRKGTDYRTLDSDKRHATVESMRLSIGKVDLKGVAGLTDVKIVIRETFLLPLTHPHLFNFFQDTVKRCCRCLLYGPPGTGKTLLAQAIASELGAGLYYVSCAGILSCYIGESEKNVKELFEHALEQGEPSIIFFDEIDSVCRKRTEGESEHSRRLKTELLKYFENPGMDESQVYILSATNCPWDLDAAFLRRFQRHIYVPLPDREARQQIVSQQLGQLRALLTEDDWDQILNCTEGFSGSDLTNFVSIAVAQPNREILRATHWRCFDGEHVIPCDAGIPNAFHATLDDVPPEKVMARSVMLSDFLYAARETPRTVTDEHILQFENFKRQFSR